MFPASQISDTYIQFYMAQRVGTLKPPILHSIYLPNPRAERFLIKELHLLRGVIGGGPKADIFSSGKPLPPHAGKVALS